MPVLDNARHEAFASALAKGLSASEAYQRAGYKRNDGNAGRLNRNEQVQSRVAELQEMVAQGVVVDRQWVIGKLVENVDRAMQAQPIIVGGEESGEYRYDGSVANKALELLGKEIGMFVERSENVNRNYDVTDEPATETDWAAQHAKPN